MKRILLPPLVLVLLLSPGCQQPTDVELIQDGSVSELEVLPVVIPDTNFTAASVDSAAILPEDLVRFGGTLLIHQVTLDAGPQVATFAYAQGFVVDTLERYLGRAVGFGGVDLGILTLNGSPLIRLPHRIRVKPVFVRDTVLTRGYEYVADLTGRFLPNTRYVWQALTPFGTFSHMIQAPDELVVESPRGGTVVSRERDLELVWGGRRGVLRIFVSAHDPLTGKAKPLLELRSRTNTGRALLPAKLLRKLPRLHRHYVFTFVLANREEMVLPRPAGGRRVLVQAASVVSTYVELR